ncbi:DNA-binding protein HEXBP-like [Nylanderia fulva]|uniref:DNA-binding protein HEXBP-like n=1 Tax=Nylanderia fulva TaxID=613905 RepID=UPI0010FB3EB0|nr:DNA-binding protein HEXBP-like [Nylanderia fulva]
MRIGWAIVRAEILEARPLQCYKCLEGGHVRARCPNNVDRSGRCYRCGQDGHAAKNCTADVKCPVCADKGLLANHRAGSRTCTPVQKGKRGVLINKVDRSQTGTKAPIKGKQKDLQGQDKERPLIDFNEEPKE